MTSQHVDLLLFDIDGTLTEPRAKITEEMERFLEVLSQQQVPLAVVGGSDLEKQDAQLGSARHLFKHRFAENGLVQMHGETCTATETLADHLGEVQLGTLINWILKHLSRLSLPFKRGTFIEYRSGMLNVAFPGRSVSREQRKAFEAWDRKAKVREKFATQLAAKFPNLQCAIGGEISVDVFPQGWDKTYCLQFLGFYKNIHFFGDKTEPGGNDHALYTHSWVTGHKVTSFHETMAQVTKLLGLFPSNASAVPHPRTIVTSGYFNPLHVGHLELLESSKAFATQRNAQLLVIVNNDQQVLLKKGCPPAMCEEERMALVKALRSVDEVFLSVDAGPSICESLQHVATTHTILAFTKGGDRFATEVPESAVCRDLNIALIDGFGEKIQSSTALTEAAQKGTTAPMRMQLLSDGSSRSSVEASVMSLSGLSL
jgi:phosphomannomutase